MFKINPKTFLALILILLAALYFFPPTGGDVTTDYSSDPILSRKQSQTR